MTDGKKDQQLDQPCGMQNQGNTCYMDSAIQVITNSRHVAQCLVDNKNAGPLTNAGAELVLAHGKLNSLTPSTIKQLMGQKHYIFSGFGQQDSHEFISNYLEDAHKEMNVLHQKQYQQMEYADESTPEESYVKFNKCQDSFESSPLQKILQFTLINQFICKDCNQKTFSFQAEQALVLDLQFLDVQIDSPKPVMPMSGFSSFFSMRKPQKKTDLLQCLINYFNDSVVHKTCSKCKQMSEHMKRTRLYTVPLQLIIVLKRFDEDREKIDHIVEFKQQIQLNQFMYKDLETQFNLDAVSLHSGGVWGGHYTAYVIRNGISYNCDDSWVSQAEINYSDDRAYVLSYSQ